jgi:hypothetical protein
MLLSSHICVLVRSRFIENRVIEVAEVVEGVWRHTLTLIAEIISARIVCENRLDKNSDHLFNIGVRAK